MFRFALAAALPAFMALAGAAAANPGVPLDRLLAGQRVIYDDPATGQPDPGFWQEWRADGTTVFHPSRQTNVVQEGRWKVEDGRYCSVFGEEGARWICWEVTAADGRVRFVARPRAPSAPFVGQRRFEGRFEDRTGDQTGDQIGRRPAAIASGRAGG